ncbi:MAG: hypothetical protein KH304_06135 [Clostridium sp.]|nr:hypothetical protein [Faecalicatena contorta]MBS6763148.1 hypothetical protein [Clostridium sp.]
MKEKVKKCGKELGQALIQLLAWASVGIFVGMGIAVGFFATSVILLH